MSDEREVTRMMNLVDEYDLGGRDFVHKFSYDQLAYDFNGIGPEWFPEDLRKLIDNLHVDLLPAAFIHDVRWSHSDGTVSSFIKSNEELSKNGRKIACAKYSWYNPMRYILIRQSNRFGNLCQVFGWQAYQAAHKHANK